HPAVLHPALEAGGKHIRDQDALGVETVAVEALQAVAAPAARADAREDHAVADVQLGNTASYLGDLADALMPEDAPRLDLRRVALQDVQVGAADRRGDHPDDDVGRMLDHRVGNLIPALPAGPVVDERLHGGPPFAPEPTRDADL